MQRADGIGRINDRLIVTSNNVRRYSQIPRQQSPRNFLVASSQLKALLRGCFEDVTRGSYGETAPLEFSLSPNLAHPVFLFTSI